MDAYPHIPEHRRLPLFTKLLQTVAEEKYLYACTCLCVEGLVTKNPIPDTTNEYEWKVRRPASHSIHLDSIQRQIHLDCLTTILLPQKDRKGSVLDHQIHQIQSYKSHTFYSSSFALHGYCLLIG